MQLPALTAEQQTVLDAILAWLDGPDRELTVGGYAGTGKSLLIAHLLQSLDIPVAVCAFTGKAASVLQRKGIDSAQTLHSFLYTCTIVQGKPHFTPNTHFHHRLLIVDEASMLSTDLLSDIRAHFLRPKRNKVLFVGDHGQLDPIGDNPGLMLAPTLRLETIHRQALSSPILRFAHHLREEHTPSSFEAPPPESAGERGQEGPLVIAKRSALDIDPSFQVIAGFNRTRATANAIFRDVLGHKETLCPGERLICLRNNKEYGLFNGLMGEVTKIRRLTPSFIYIDFLADGFPPFLDIPLYRPQLGADSTIDLWPLRHDLSLRLRDIALFDYAYCITCHKAQGSEWDKVAVLEEPSHLWSMPRWRYTSATRASQTLHYYLP